MTLLADTNALLVLMDAQDSAYESVRRLAEKESIIVPASVLPEVDYLAGKYFGARVARTFIDDVIQGAYDFLQVDMSDIRRAYELMGTYADAEIGYVDASIVALAERYNLNRILTFDRRHFSMFRPKGLEYLELLP